MSGTLQLVEPVELRDTHDAPNLLVEWSSRWEEFLGSIGPALSRSQARLAGEAPFGLIPLRIMLPSYLMEALLIFAAILIPAKIAQLRPYVAPRVASHDVIYYTGDELPRVEDLGGAEAGTAGRAGGDETHHRTQTIKIARGGSLVPQVADAPNLKLPSSTDAVANLLAVRPDAGPPPAEGLRSSRSAPNLATSIVAPAPNVIRNYTRNGVQMDAVIAPAPNMPRDRGLIAPTFNATLIPPAPSVPESHKIVAPAMIPAVIPPAPHVSRDRTIALPSLNASVVAPAPTVAADRSRSAMALAANVIPPAPTVASRQMSHAPVQVTNETVVPPPVSAPERARSRSARLSLPAPQVVAPPPSADIASDTHRVAPGGADPSRSVVPPPPSQTGGSFMSSIIGKIFGASEVVPPPPSISPRQNNTPGASLASNVVPPPPSIGQNSSGADPHGYRNGQGAPLSTNVVAPPPSVGTAGGTGTRARGAAPYLGAQSVVPPPPQLAGAGGGTGKVGGGKGASGGTLLANNIVPPPPSVGAGNNSAGSGLGRRGAGLGAPSDVGANLAPPKNGGSGSNTGAVISTQPGPKVGVPITSSTGSLAMSPSGTANSGIGGSGGGSGIGHGNGTGSALSGSGTGAANSGPGRGSDPAARGGISPNPGPGGAGSMTSGNPPVRGVEISGGSSIVTLPSFGDDPAANDPNTPSRTNVKQRSALDVTIVATASSGGAFEPYKKLLRGVQYTTYLDTSLGTVVMEFADESATSHQFGSALTAPSPVRVELLSGTPRGRMVVACTLDASGNIGNIKVLEAGSGMMTAKIVAALRSWKFQPAKRGDTPVQVTAILGFGINTDDRF
jgi:TonB family protein